MDLNSLRNISYPAEWTGVNVPVVFRMKIKISKSRISLLTSGIICLNLLKNKIFKIKLWSLASENTWKYKKYIFRIIFYVSLIKNDKQKKEKTLTFLNHLLALDNVFSTKSEEQEVNLVWPLTSWFGLMTDMALVDSALVDAALRKSGLISNGCSGLIIYLCGLRQIRPYIKWKRIIKI